MIYYFYSNKQFFFPPITILYESSVNKVIKSRITLVETGMRRLVALQPQGTSSYSLKSKRSLGAIPITTGQSETREVPPIEQEAPHPFWALGGWSTWVLWVKLLREKYQEKSPGPEGKNFPLHLAQNPSAAKSQACLPGLPQGSLGTCHRTLRWGSSF